jgi:hypothetical protein
MIFQRKCGVCVEVQREMLKTIQRIQGTRKDAIRAQNQGISVQQWWEVNFQGISLKDHGINNETSTPYRPQQNKMAKSANCTILEMVKNMLYVQKLEILFEAKW